MAENEVCNEYLTWNSLINPESGEYCYGDNKQVTVKCDSHYLAHRLD